MHFSTRLQRFAYARLLVSYLTGSGPAFSSTLTTIALYDSSLRWFEARFRKLASRGLSLISCAARLLGKCLTHSSSFAPSWRTFVQMPDDMRLRPAKLLNGHCHIGQEKAILEPIWLGAERPKSLMSRHTGHERPALLTSKTHKRDKAFCRSSKAPIDLTRACQVWRSIVSPITRPALPSRSDSGRRRPGLLSLSVSRCWRDRWRSCSFGCPGDIRRSSTQF